MQHMYGEEEYDDEGEEMMDGDMGEYDNEEELMGSQALQAQTQA